MFLADDGFFLNVGLWGEGRCMRDISTISLILFCILHWSALSTFDSTVHRWVLSQGMKKIESSSKYLLFLTADQMKHFFYILLNQWSKDLLLIIKIGGIINISLLIIIRKTSAWFYMSLLCEELNNAFKAWVAGKKKKKSGMLHKK